MLRFTMRTSYLIGLLLASSFLLAQTEFSAEIVDTQKPGTPAQAKVYFGKDKIRLDPLGGNRMGAIIMNLTTQTFTALMAQQHMYMEMPVQMASQRVAYNFFRTGDAESACADWMQVVKNKGGTCHKAGSETVNGRDTVKYETTNANGDSGTFWLDSKLRFAVKWKSKNGGGELRNIQEGTQPASLFEIPAGFTKTDVGGMMQRPQ
ncbi:MAG TPA: hypothetical protein VIW68_10110 [Candidatus Sulfotelmatobacter sp.]